MGADRSLCNENMVASARLALFTSPGLFTDTSEHIRFLRFSFFFISFSLFSFWSRAQGVRSSLKLGGGRRVGCYGERGSATL